MKPSRGAPVALALCACVVAPLLVASPAAADGTTLAPALAPGVSASALVDGAWRYERQWEQWQDDWQEEPLLSYESELDPYEGGAARWAVVAVDRHGNSRFDSGEAFSYVSLVEPDPLPQPE
ncbi:hypothetical protein JNUCC64_25475 [Streptomyces sp. JNUCC 64]